MKLILLTFVVFVLFSDVCAQVPDDLIKKAFSSESKRIHNTPGAPVRLEITKDASYFRLVNTSEKTITKFTFACILRESGVTRIAKSFEPKASYLVEKSIEKDNYLIFGGTESGISGCARNNERLAVFKLTFSDGTIWSFGEKSETNR